MLFIFLADYIYGRECWVLKVYIKTILTLNPANDEQTSEKRSGESNFRFGIRVEKNILSYRPPIHKNFR